MVVPNVLERIQVPKALQDSHLLQDGMKLRQLSHRHMPATIHFGSLGLVTTVPRSSHVPL